MQSIPGGILNGILLGDDVYMASAMVTKEDEALMEALKSSVYEYSWEMEPSDEKKEVTPEVTPEATPEATPEPTPQATPEPTPETTPEPTPQATPEPTPEAAPEPTPQATPEPAPPVPPEDITRPVSRSGYCHSPAYVRSGPDNTSSVVGSVEEGQTVTIPRDSQLVSDLLWRRYSLCLQRLYPVDIYRDLCYDD